MIASHSFAHSNNVAKRSLSSCLLTDSATSSLPSNKRACLGGRTEPISITPPPIDDVKHFIDGEDEEEDEEEEDDWSFYGVSKHGNNSNTGLHSSSRYTMVPPSPPAAPTYHKNALRSATGDNAFYSDDEDDDEQQLYDSHFDQKSITMMKSGSKTNDFNDQTNNKKHNNDYYYNDLTTPNQSFSHHRINNIINTQGNSSQNIGHLTKRKRSSSSKKRPRHTIVPESDVVARQRCFDYLVAAIDEVWAQYCDCTSSEVEFFGEEEALPRSPISLYGDEDDDFKNGSYNQGSIAESKAIKERQEQLMNLKKRLLNAKYFFSDLVDSKSYDACVAFWRRWDLVKYSTIDLVEDTDEDDVVEQVCEELEEGRAFYGYRD